VETLSALMRKCRRQYMSAYAHGKRNFFKEELISLLAVYIVIDIHFDFYSVNLDLQKNVLENECTD
jgi:hypothetical protein